jgi:hypothetical protein
MIIGSIFTLFVVPSIYMLVARTHAPDLDWEREAGAMREPAEAAL